LVKQMKLLDRLGDFSKTFLVALALLLVLTQSIVNYLAGPDFSFVLFYLLPVSVVAWLVGRRAGFVVALACVVGYFLTEFLSAHFDGRTYLTVINAFARLGAFLFVVYFVSALRRSHQHERELARTDELTGATNRRSFFEAAQSEINRARRHRHPFTVAYIDVDNFKGLNDRSGHAAGDALLRETTGAIKATVREIDLVARLGGDEFVVLLPETDEEAAHAVVSRVRKCLDDLAARRGWQVTFSIGVVTWTTPPRTVDTMIRQADDTMYEVKNTGKNRVAHLTLSGEPAQVSEPASVG
jgi:diguanylate cyclase (GGDEF)-like protein